jgi:hypothetical protein
MDKKSISKSQIYNELDIEMRSKWFGRLEKKYIYHIDTFYFVGYVDVDWKESDSAKLFKAYLNKKKKVVEASLEFETLWEPDLLMKFGYSVGFYKYHIGKNDAFDIFVADSMPDKETPPIFVQLRSQFLWLYGSELALKKAAQTLENILNRYGIRLIELKENRIDYAFHTNYIQDLTNFFPEKHLSEMQVSDFKRWHKEGYFFNDYCFCDYFTLGRRKSNNVFFRVYNKTKEVVEMGYKQFFIWIWLYNGLISRFDAYVLEKCFEKSSWYYKEKARLEFYLEHGKDERAKREIEIILDDKNYPAAKCREIADILVPDVTVVTNIEFQTKRKFYYSLMLPNMNNGEQEYFKRLSNLLNLQRDIIDLLTYDVIRFVKYKGQYNTLRRDQRPLASWWERLRACRIQEYVTEEKYELVRQYQRQLDVKKLKKMTINKIATIAVYNQDDLDQCFEKDVLDFLSSLNDNDLNNYFQYKNKKALELKSKLEGVSKNKVENSYSLLDKKTGEIKYI